MSLTRAQKRVLGGIADDDLHEAFMLICERKRVARAARAERRVAMLEARLRSVSEVRDTVTAASGKERQ